MRLQRFRAFIAEVKRGKNDSPNKLSKKEKDAEFHHWNGIYQNPTVHKHIENVIKRSSRTKHHMTVYRGLQNHPHMDEHGHHVHSHNTATAKERSHAMRFATTDFDGMDREHSEHGHIVHIHVPRGSKVHHFEMEGEHEVVLKKGSKLKYSKHTTHETHRHEDGNTTHVTVHHATLTDDGSKQKVHRSKDDNDDY